VICENKCYAAMLGHGSTTLTKGNPTLRCTRDVLAG